MPTKCAKWYGVYDDDVKIFEGSVQAISFYLERSLTAVYKAIEHRTLVNGCSIRYIDTRHKDGLELIDKPTKEEKPTDDRYDMLWWHLYYKGNTSVSFDPEPYLEKLKENGIECKVTPKEDFVEKKKVTTRGRKPKKRYHYYVEVANATRGSQSI